MSTTKLLTHAWVAIIIVAALLLVPTLSRTAPYLDSGFERFKVQDSKLGLTVDDSYLQGNTQLLTTPYDVVVYYLKDFIPYEKLILYLPVFFGILTLLLMYPVLRRHDFAKEEITIMYIMAGLTPTFIAFFTFNHAYSLAYTLIALFFACYKKFPFISYVSLVTLAFYGPVVFAGALIFFYILFGINKKTIIQSIVPIGVFIWHMITVYPIKLTTVAFDARNISSEVGSLIAVGMFLYVLAGVGFTHSWNNNKIKLLGVLGLVALSLWIPTIVFILMPIMLFLATKGLFKIAGQHWRVDFLKQATIFALILGLLFSSLSYEDRVVNQLPNEEYLEGMNWIKEYTPSSSIVLTYPDKGSWIETLAKRRVLFNEYYASEDFVEILFHSYNLDDVRTLLEAEEVTHIVIDRDMRRGQVWERDNQELLFLLTDERYFKNEFENDAVTIYAFND